MLNMNDYGFEVVGYNRTTEKMDAFLANRATNTKVLGVHSLKEVVSKLNRLRRGMVLVKGSKPADTGVNLVTAENLEQTEIKELLNPPLNKYLN